MVLGSVPHTNGVLDELSRMGADVPNDLSVIGFGDESAFGWWGPGLTTISLPNSDVAASCGLWFVRRLDTPPERGGQPYESVSKGSLVLRGSTAPPGQSASDRLDPLPAPRRIAPHPPRRPRRLHCHSRLSIAAPGTQRGASHRSHRSICDPPFNISRPATSG